MSTPDEAPPLLPPPEILNDPAIESTSIADLVERDPLTLTDAEVFQIIHKLRAQRRNFAELERQKAKGNVSPRARKLPKIRHEGPLPGLDDLELDLGSLVEDSK